MVNIDADLCYHSGEKDQQKEEGRNESDENFHDRIIRRCEKPDDALL